MVSPRSIQPPNILHCVYTPVKTLATGGHFYCYELSHLTELACDVDREFGLVTTNQVHPGALRLIANLALALPNHWDKPMLKIPFLSLALMVLDQSQYEGPSKGLASALYYPNGQYIREIKGKSKYATQVVKWVLQCNGLPTDVNGIRCLVHQRAGRDLNNPGTELVDLSCLEGFEFTE